MTTAVSDSSRTIDLTAVPQQENFVFDRHPIVGWIGGRGCAKSASGVFKLMDYIVHWPGARLIVIAPSYPQLEAGAKQAFLDWVPPSWITRSNWSADKMWADLSPDGKEPRRIYFRNAANPDSYRSIGGGSGLAAAWIDEIALCGREVVDILMPALRQVGYPRQLWFTTTPRRNWIYEMFVDPATRIRAVGGKNQISLYYATSYDNPFFSAQLLGILEQQYSGAFYEQEILGRFVAFKGMVFPNFSYQTHIKPLPKDIQWKRVIGGVDFGLSDPSVVLLGGEDASGRYWVFKEFYRPRCSGRDHLSVLAQWRQEHKVQRYHCDPHANSEIATLQASGIPAVKGNSAIELGIRLVNNLLEPSRAGGPGLFIAEGECPNLVREMGAYSHDSRNTGLDESFSDSIKAKQSDHAVDALRYLVVGLSGGYAVSEYNAVRFG